MLAAVALQDIVEEICKPGTLAAKSQPGHGQGKIATKEAYIVRKGSNRKEQCWFNISLEIGQRQARIVSI